MNRSSLAKTLAFTFAAATLAAPLVAQADVPGQTQLKGNITAFDGKYGLHVRTRNGDVDAVTLHQGTIINPTGLTLQPGMPVTILGNRLQNGTLGANEIDTPYQVAYAPAYAYAYPAFGDPFYRYGYGSPFFGPRFYGGFYGGFHRFP